MNLEHLANPNSTPRIAVLGAGHSGPVIARAAVEARVDVMNYWPPVDGTQPIFEDALLGSSEIVQERLAGSTVVKPLNPLGYHDLDEARRPAGDPDRISLGVAGDDPAAVDLVAGIVE